MIVVDTHVAVWDALKPEKLSEKAKQAITEANKKDGIILSDISLWEIGMLIQKGRLKLHSNYMEFIELLLKSNKYILHRISPKIVNVSQVLPYESIDYADRIIVSTSIVTRSDIVTCDPGIRRLTQVESIW